MALTTTAKIAIGLTGAVAVTGVGIGIARARKSSNFGMKRDDGDLPYDSSTTYKNHYWFKRLGDGNDDGYLDARVGSSVEILMGPNSSWSRVEVGELVDGRLVGLQAVDLPAPQGWVEIGEDFVVKLEPLGGHGAGDRGSIRFTGRRPGIYVVRLLDGAGDLILAYPESEPRLGLIFKVASA